MKFLYLAAIMLTGLISNAQTRKYVTQNGSGSKDGSSWANAWDAKIFADTLNTQPAGTEIWIAKGVYKPSKDTLGIRVPQNVTDPFSGVSRKPTFLIPSSVKIFGGFAGTELNISDRVKSNIFGQNITYLDGAYPSWNYADPLTNAASIITFKNSADNTTADGFYLRHFSQWCISVTSSANSYSSPLILNCYFGESVSSLGGILINTPGSITSIPKIGNCIFKNDTHGSYWPIGAANNCKPSINNCLFIMDQYNNSCINFRSYGNNGAQLIPSRGGSITNCTFYNTGGSYFNTPTINGIGTDSIFITNCIFQIANPTDVFHFGGGLFSIRNSFLQAQTHYNAVAPAFQSGNTLGSPQFKDSLDIDGPDNIYSTADDGLQLKSTSPGINYGLNDSLPAFSVKDVAGNSRVSGCKVDVGAYEYQTPATNITLPESTLESCTQYPIPDATTTFIDPVTCKVSAKISPAGADPVTGILKVCVAKNASVPFVNGVPYVQRHYNIEPVKNASTATARITLYFTQPDFDSYNSAAAAFPKLPVSPTDAAGKSNIKIEQNHGTSLTSVPGTYSGSTVYIDPDDNDIIWNVTSNIWEVSFHVTGFSGFFIRSSTPLSSLYFRTKASGNWHDVSSWESSSDNSNFTAATTTPDYNSNTITVRHKLTVTANLTVDQTVINSPDTLFVNPNVVLTINNGVATDLTVSMGANLTLRSTAVGTASIGNSSGSVISYNNITVERYFSNKRAWRLIGLPFSGSGETIKNSWMEGGTSASNNPKPGYGTHITTFTGDPNAANFDAAKPASSIRIYSNDNFNSDAAHTPNTNTSVAANQAYFLFVRGDRSVTLNNSSVHSSTTLRITGYPHFGVSTRGVMGNSFSLIANPYPSNIDFDAVKANSSNTSINTFYVWDASLGSVGQYRTITISGTAPNYTYTATPGGTNNAWKIIESGSAFFVPGNRTVDFNESAKTTGTPPSSLFRTTSDNKTRLAINLFIVNADNSVILADGVREVFDNYYTTAIDKYDAKKIAGFDINLGIANNNEVLSVESRPLPNDTEIIALKLWNASPGNYAFGIEPANFPPDISAAYMLDNYLNTKTRIDISKNTTINFSINAEPASFEADRFSIVFDKGAVTTDKPSIVVYPNPVENGVIQLRMNNMPKGIYSVRLINYLGQTVLNKEINHVENTRIETINAGKIKGAYTIEVLQSNSSKTVSKVLLN